MMFGRYDSSGQTSPFRAGSVCFLLHYVTKDAPNIKLTLEMNWFCLVAENLKEA